ncbi:undecaprenyl/decaprenyl-phosphate alpha-N-acetylglucosaminyl 1-phosphate transferase (plasmid) [Pedobacter sp. BS3]|uniref:MraY family glycosyltransferase n=1 Tax=Pedobacter sp. BS3 TaxID=2567937 RepID=UPI0011ED820F|nr:MraY family glycosyltransferase [Pedobacter sp. BS3]TZF86464.1 undecaprenyl/decaprenyl-phosphate alpha-N-acetylglucosaminyl 1-phosphate transferase [Pedobacter sp. BS3]
MPEPLFYISVVLFSFLLVLLAIPSIIHVAKERSLFDDMDTDRKDHSCHISRLGGVAIFCSFMITCLVMAGINGFGTPNYLLASAMILFVVGLKDDLWGVNPSTKFGMQFIVALIMVLLANVRLTSLYGVFNIHDLPYIPSVIISVLVIMFITNAFNLIDGIDGLAGITGIVVSIAFGVLFARMKEVTLSCMAFSLAGACMGFLKYNFTPAKIFMGDTGSLLIGFIAAVLSIHFIELNKVGVSPKLFYSSAPSIAVAILIGPIFDAIRVFVIRIVKKTSPFAGDRNHIHHRMLLLGLNHLQTAFILLLFNVLMIYVTLLMRDFGNFLLIGIQFSICVLFNMILSYLIRSRQRKSYRFINFLW